MFFICLFEYTTTKCGAKKILYPTTNPYNPKKICRDNAQDVLSNRWVKNWFSNFYSSELSLNQDAYETPIKKF